VYRFFVLGLPCTQQTAVLHAVREVSLRPLVSRSVCRLRPPRKPRTVSVHLSSVKGTFLAALAGACSAT